MDETLALYTIDGDVAPAGHEADWPRADVNTAEGRPLFHYSGDQPGTTLGAGLGPAYQLYIGPTVAVVETPAVPVANPEGATTVDGTPTGQPEPTAPEVPVAPEPTPGLPDGLTQNADGSITGTPTVATAPEPAPAPEPEPAPAQPGPEVATGEPSPELPPTTVDDFDPNDPRTQEQTGTATVPDNPSSNATPPNTVDVPGSAHGWDAGVTTLDTGWVTSAALPEAWRAALSTGHGEQDGFIKIPAHLRDIEDAVLALANAVIANVGDPGRDTYRIEAEVSEFDGEVNIETRIRRKAVEPSGGVITGAVSSPSAVQG